MAEAKRGLWGWFIRSQAYNLPKSVDSICTYVVKDPATRPTPYESWPIKSVVGNYLYRIDWSVYAAVDPIVSSVWVVDLGLVVWSEDFTDVLTSCFIGYGRDHATYALHNTVTLTSTAEYTQTVKIIVDNKACIIVPPAGPGGAELACL